MLIATMSKYFWEMFYFAINATSSYLQAIGIPSKDSSDSAGSSRWYCAQYKFTYLLTYLLKTFSRPKCIPAYA